MPVDDAPADEGEGAPRQSYNFAPGYNGVVYRADVGDRGASLHDNRSRRPARQQQQQREEQGEEPQVDGEGGDETTDKDGEPVDDATEESVEHDEENETVGGNAVDGGRTGEKKKKMHKNARAGAQYKLQSMKWGLIPFWTKRNPDYAAMLKTINARDDSLAQNGGMWNTMKKGKRCVVVVEGFYEWYVFLFFLFSFYFLPRITFFRY